MDLGIDYSIYIIDNKLINIRYYILTLSKVLREASEYERNRDIWIRYTYINYKYIISVIRKTKVLKNHN